MENETVKCTFTYEEGDYELTLRIGSIFILLVISFIGVVTPTLVKANNWKLIDKFLFVGKFFGGGVITATGFIHIFPEAVKVLSDECLSEFFQVYGASAGLFALIGALFTHMGDYLATSVFKKSSHEKGTEETGHAHSHLLDNSSNNAATVYILEAGIAVHSIIIGVDLGLTIEEFRPLLMALVFHQFFEGIGLGYKLAELKSKKIIRPVINSMIYAITTPLGVVIGILSHIHSSPTNYVSSTEAKGIIDAMAGGILIYVSLVNMLYEEFKAESFQNLPVTHKILNYFSFYLGAGIMSVLALWA